MQQIRDQAKEYYENKTAIQKKEEICSVKARSFGNYCNNRCIMEQVHQPCCINKKVIPKEALEPLTHIVFFNGLNSRQQATHRIKQGYFLIEENKFKIPLIYAFDMRDNNGETAGILAEKNPKALKKNGELCKWISSPRYYNRRQTLKQVTPAMENYSEQSR
ncbi:hypothetical protein Tco_0718541 [Tanacetum coccineum]